ncbi:cell wall-binding repeat-containing protein [Desulfosporosinus sp. SYSU MS00001]|uniref:RCC1 domain-containing protein n=1 Tax=Desulfosporosinus sp. SYSU MS00001 TaxID=3416284 RepID=UPI003CE7F5B2
MKTFKFRLTGLLASMLILVSTILVPLLVSPAPALASINDRPASASSQLAAGVNFALAVDGDGNVWAWGNNSDGQLGQGKTDSSSTASPVQVKDLTNIIAVSAGGAHALALKADGTVWAWGSNEEGQLGVDQDSPVTTSVQVQGLQNIVAIAAGLDFSLALGSDGRVWAWGDNEFRQVNENSNTLKYTAPQLIANLPGVVKIAAGSAWCLALKNDGTVWTWGAQKVVMDTDTEPADFIGLTQVKGISDIVSISAGFSHSLALRGDGTVWGWGSNELMQLGNSNQQWFDSPVQISSLKRVSAISAGAYMSMALGFDGSVWTLGGNIYGQLGSGIDADTQPLTSLPVKGANLSCVTSISVGYGFALGRAGGKIWGWGLNTDGQLGNGTVNVLGQDGYNGTDTPVMGQHILYTAPASYLERVSGNQAVNTAVEIAKKGWPDGSSAVILATVVNLPDALAAATLAHQYDAPILLTNSKALDSDVQDEIDRLHPAKIIIVGGTAVVSGDIENSLKQKYSDITRLAGWDQYETAARIADYYYSVNPDAPKKVVIANGNNFPDALSISSWAAYNHIPILLTKNNQLPEATNTALKDHEIADAILVGGRAVINDDVANAITKTVSAHWDSNDQNKTLNRYWGMDQYETSVAVARGLRANVNTIIIATGENFPDALAGSALAARTGSPIILVNKQFNKASVMNFLADSSGQIRQIYLLGGKAVIPDSSLEYINSYMAG